MIIMIIASSIGGVRSVCDHKLYAPFSGRDALGAKMCQCCRPGWESAMWVGFWLRDIRVRVYAHVCRCVWRLRCDKMWQPTHLALLSSFCGLISQTTSNVVGLSLCFIGNTPQNEDACERSANNKGTPLTTHNNSQSSQFPGSGLGPKMTMQRDAKKAESCGDVNTKGRERETAHSNGMH